MEELNQNTNLVEITPDEFQLYRFLAEYVKVGVAWKAYKNLHPDVTDASCRALASKQLSKINIAEVMEEFGLTDTQIIKQLHKNAFGATRKLLKRTVIHAQELPGAANKSDDMRFYKNRRGQIIVMNAAEVTDYIYEDTFDAAASNKALETALKLKKKLGPESVTNQTIDLEGATIQIVNYGEKRGGEYNGKRNQHSDTQNTDETRQRELTHQATPTPTTGQIQSDYQVPRAVIQGNGTITGTRASSTPEGI